MNDPHHPAAPAAAQGHPGHGAPGHNHHGHSAPTHHGPGNHSIHQGPAITPMRHAPVSDPIELVDETADASPEAKKIRAFGVADVHHHDGQFKRTPAITGHGACRMRSFHGKLSEAGLEYLDHSVNQWLDAHPDVDVKFVTTSVGLFDGKIKEPALIMNVWY